ncbi:YppE family protein [Bacillus atrophaeus]|uniref:YppE family protein n=2 Tax=Bacillus atrophaeus TaxID=1452 RepID=UPI000D0473A2|nr:YppE family protein [Bacillus atrophaeus]MCY8811358.1 YppE family protein [Bacillus atrophaeus]MCY8819932.1 YppE family protein [Bacillus atrophaeus]MCY8828868.1 YppE family protein [Bacillus atrophaeus]MCY8834074.1 YppE family protein [Bacillus atrophaeus]MCY8959899.1 YppE family protein [Bacillus atrophaeus]
MLHIQAFLEKTKQMIEAAEKGAVRYEDGKENDRSYDFFATIKPAVEQNEELVSQWTENALEFIKIHRPKYIYEEQIHAVKENFLEIMLQSYVHHIHKKRYKDLTESVLYTLQTVKDEIAKEGSL